MDTLTRSRRATRLNLLLALAAFAGILMVMVVAAVDAHWLLLVVGIGVFFVLIALFGPPIYKLEPRPHHKVRMHRPLGVVDIDLTQPYEVRASLWGSAIEASGHSYPVLRSVGKRQVIDEWLRRAAR